MEIWKKIHDFDYLISNKGRVCSTITGYISNGFKNKDGYVKVDLYKNKIKHRFAMHRLVAVYFLMEPTNEQIEWALTTKSKQVHIHHKDNNRSNNEYSNLEWCTASYNVKKSYDSGDAVPNCTGRKLTTEQIQNIKKEYELYEGSIIEYAREVCSKYNVVSKTIRRILYNQTWKD